MTPKRTKRRIYIAGPMAGIPAFNYPAFNQWATTWRNINFHVENPAEIGAAFGTPEQINADPCLLAAVMAADIKALKTCEAIFLLNGWENSRGAKMELAAALAEGFEVYTEAAHTSRGA